MNIAEKAGEAIEPYIMSALLAYLASEAGRKRVAELVDAALVALIKRLETA